MAHTTFTLNNGAEVFRCFTTNLDRLHPVDVDELSMATLKAVHAANNSLSRDKKLGVVYLEEDCLAVFAAGSYIPPRSMAGF